jgi:hypothetical protein
MTRAWIAIRIFLKDQIDMAGLPTKGEAQAEGLADSSSRSRQELFVDEVEESMLEEGRRVFGSTRASHRRRTKATSCNPQEISGAPGRILREAIALAIDPVPAVVRTAGNSQRRGGSRLIPLGLKMGTDNARYEERCPEVSAKSKQTRTAKMIRQIRALGYRVEPTGRTDQSSSGQPSMSGRVFDPAISSRGFSAG